VEGDATVCSPRSARWAGANLDIFRRELRELTSVRSDPESGIVTFDFDRGLSVVSFVFRSSGTELEFWQTVLRVS
jgi:hypothetical protein